MMTMCILWLVMVYEAPLIFQIRVGTAEKIKFLTLTSNPIHFKQECIINHNKLRAICTQGNCKLESGPWMKLFVCAVRWFVNYYYKTRLGLCKTLGGISAEPRARDPGRIRVQWMRRRFQGRASGDDVRYAHPTAHCSRGCSGTHLIMHVCAPSAASEPAAALSALRASPLAPGTLTAPKNTRNTY